MLSFFVVSSLVTIPIDFNQFTSLQKVVWIQLHKQLNLKDYCYIVGMDVKRVTLKRAWRKLMNDNIKDTQKEDTLLR